MNMVVLGAIVGAVIGHTVQWVLIGAAIGFFLTLIGADLGGKKGE